MSVISALSQRRFAMLRPTEQILDRNMTSVLKKKKEREGKRNRKKSWPENITWHQQISLINHREVLNQNQEKKFCI